MDLREEFEEDTGISRPVEPYSCAEEPELWAEIVEYEEAFSEYLESELTASRTQNAELVGALVVCKDVLQKVAKNDCWCDGWEDSTCSYHSAINQIQTALRSAGQTEDGDA